MPETRDDRWLPHEIVFGLFLAATAAGLMVAKGAFARDTLLFAALAVLAAGLAAWCRRHPTNARWRVRLAFYPVAMNLAYFALKTAAPALNPQLRDAALQAADRALIGGNASLWMERLAHPALTEFMSFCYLVFFPYLFVSWAYYLAQRDLGVAKKFWSGFFMIYGLGFCGYILVPAAGPHLDPGLAARFTVPFHGVITDFNTRVVLSGSNRVDCFPSLHCAISSYLLLFDWRHRRWRFWLYLVPCVGLWFSTIYLRYHYFVDVLAGFALSGAALWFVNRHFRTPEKNP